jgi:hypothetical protein
MLKHVTEIERALDTLAPQVTALRDVVSPPSWALSQAPRRRRVVTFATADGVLQRK